MLSTACWQCLGQREPCSCWAGGSCLQLPATLGALSSNGLVELLRHGIVGTRPCFVGAVLGEMLKFLQMEDQELVVPDGFSLGVLLLPVGA